MDDTASREPTLCELWFCLPYMMKREVPLPLTVADDWSAYLVSAFFSGFCSLHSLPV